MEFLTGAIFGSQIAFFVLLVLLCVILFVSEATVGGQFAFVSFIGFLTLMYFFGNSPLSIYLTWSNFGLYLLAGFLYSLLRTFGKRFEFEDENERRMFELQEHVICWWLNWPVSLLYWVFGRLLETAINAAYKRISYAYEFLLGRNF